jgi:phosphoglycolate phosphatase-like HAD superfamily hydrolase
MQNPTQNRDAVRVQIEPGFAWDAQEAYLFDIDGTLLREPDRIHMDSFVPSIRRVTGVEVSLDQVCVHGNTDTGILTEACHLAGIPSDLLAQKMDAIREEMCRMVAEQRQKMTIRLMPGVEEALTHLTRKGAALGVATGNLEKIGWIKIEVAGLRKWFRFGGFSDHFPVRAELIANAASKAKELAGIKARVCVVGDTPRDIEAAHANQLPVIAVATGNYSFEELVQLKPEVCATSLADLLACAKAAS